MGIFGFIPRTEALVEGKSPTIADALVMWSSWRANVSPCGERFDDLTNRRLADAFRALLALRDRDVRLGWIEGQVFTINDFPPPDRPADRYRETLMRWWLAIDADPR